jgi:hypothetical protein
MIFIISQKQFLKNKKMLVKPKEYLIIDGTDDSSGDLRKFCNVITVDSFNPPAKVLSYFDKKDISVDDIDEEKIKKVMKKYLKGKSFIVGVMGAAKAIVDASRPFNVLIVIKNKVYKHLSSKIVKRMKKLLEFDFIYTFDDIEEKPKLLKKEITREDLKMLEKKLKKLEAKEKED